MSSYHEFLTTTGTYPDCWTCGRLASAEVHMPPRCQGYRWPEGSICGNEKDRDLCDQCLATKAEAELPLENAAYLEEFGVERVKAYPHLTD